MGLFDGLIKYINDVPSSTYDQSKDVYNLGKGSADYLNSQAYQDVMKSLTDITGGLDYNTFVKGVSDIGTMTKLSDIQKAAMEGYSDFRLNKAFGDSGIGSFLDNADLYKYNMGTRLEPIGVNSGTNVYPELSPFLVGPTGSYFLDDGNLKTVGDPRGLSALSLGTGGLSDVIEGHTPFSRAIENAGENLGLNQHTQDWMKDISGDILSPIGFAGQTAYRAHDKATEEGGSFKGGVWADRFIDPSGTIDYSVREMGNVHREISPELTDNAQQIGTAVGGTIGSMFPVIGTGIGAAVGSGIGSKTAGGTKYYDYTGDLVDSGAAYVASKAVPNVGGPIGESVSPYIGDAAGKIVGGAAQGAVRGAASGVKPAIENQSIDPIWEGAATGVVLGGVSAGGQELYGQLKAPSALDLEDQAIADKYNKYYPNTVSNQALGYQDFTPEEVYGIQYQEMNPSFTPFTTNPELMYAAFPDPLNSYVMGGKQLDEDKLISDEHIKKYPNTFSDMAQGILALTPDEMYAKEYSSKHSILPEEGPSIWDNISDYAGKFGKAILENLPAIKDLAGALLGGGGEGGGTQTGGFGDEGGKGRKAMEQEWLTNLMKSGTGVGKSKGLNAGKVEGPEYDASFFMPGKKIKGYKNTGLYE